MQQPADFLRATKNAIRLATVLLQSIVERRSTSPVEAVRSIDMVSDLICRVCDSAELCRQTHVDPTWRKAAESVYEEANAFIFALNANRELYLSFRDLVEAGEGGISDEARHTAEQLLVEFEREGIHRSDEERVTLQQLNAEVMARTTEFQNNLRAELSSFRVAPRGALEDALPTQLLLATVPTIRAEHTTGKNLGKHPEGNPRVPGDSVVATNHPYLVQSALTHVPHPCLRRRFHLEDTNGSESNVYTLSRIVALREQVARTVGFPSFAEMMCSDRMSGSQHNVISFLLELSERIAPLAEAEAEVLLGRKRVLEAPYVVSPCTDPDAAFRQQQEIESGTDTSELVHGGRSGWPAPPQDENDLLQYVPDMHTLEPWDYRFYVAQLRGVIRDSVRMDDDPQGGDGGRSGQLSKYLTLGNVLRGLSLITETSFGVRLERQSLHPGEDWAGGTGHSVKSTRNNRASQDFDRNSDSDFTVGAEGSTGAAGDPADPVGGEVRDVMRFVLRDMKSDRELGVMYVDLFTRTGKRSAGAAHFVVRCGRKLAPGEHPVDTVLPMEESIRAQARASDAEPARTSASDPVPNTVTLGETDEPEELKEEEDNYQLPIVALITSYARPSGLHEPSAGLASSSFSMSSRTAASPSLDEVTLTFGEAETLFHEYGHALHSILSRTQFHHVWGTRGALDFIELPSHLFEKFLSDHRVAQRFLRCPESGAPVPRDMFEAHVLARRSFGALDLQQQVVHCLFDQALFAEKPMQVACAFLREGQSGTPGTDRDVVLPQSALEDPAAAAPDKVTDVRTAEILRPGMPRLDYGMRPGAVDSQSLLQEVSRRHCLVPYKARTRWQAGFSHIVNYGACYYSYLYARVFAQAVWEEVFEADPLCPQAGMRYRTLLLEKGGSEDPKKMLEAVLGYQPDPKQLVNRIFGQLESSAKGGRAGRSLDSLAYRKDSRLASLMSDDAVGLRDLVLVPI